MDSIFNLTTKRYICPYCGKWHELNGNYKLGNYTYINPLVLHCPNTQNKVHYILYKHKEFLYVGFFPCMKDTNYFFRCHTKSDFYIPENHANTLVLIFCANINKKKYLPINDYNICRACEFTSFCTPIEIAEKTPKKHIGIPLGFEFEVPKN